MDRTRYKDWTLTKGVKDYQKKEKRLGVKGTRVKHQGRYSHWFFFFFKRHEVNCREHEELNKTIRIKLGWYKAEVRTNKKSLVARLTIIKRCSLCLPPLEPRKPSGEIWEHWPMALLRQGVRGTMWIWTGFLRRGKSMGSIIITVINIRVKQHFLTFCFPKNRKCNEKN